MNLFSFFRSYTPKQKELLKYVRNYWGVSSGDLSWYENAIRHKSLIGSGRYEHTDCNERLELLGDAVLDTVITEYLFNKFPKKDEGFLTKLRSRIVNREMLSQIGKTAQLHTVIQVRIGNDDSMNKITGNAVEALIGAIYLDKGFNVAKKSILDHFVKDYLDLESVIKESQDFKSAFIEWAQQYKHKIRFETNPSEENNQQFECRIIVNEELVAIGFEKSKKKAEQAASKEASKILNF